MKLIIYFEIMTTFSFGNQKIFIKRIFLSESDVRNIQKFTPLTPSVVILHA